MAKMEFSGAEELASALDRMSRGAIRRLVEAGAEAAIEATRESIRENHHIATGGMLQSVQKGIYHEEMYGGYVDVYPQGSDPNGYSQSKKAFVINYGYGGRRTAKTGDKFITGSKNKKRTEAAVQQAMEKENEKIIRETNGG